MCVASFVQFIGEITFELVWNYSSRLGFSVQIIFAQSSHSFKHDLSCLFGKTAVRHQGTRCRKVLPRLRKAARSQLEEWLWICGKVL